VIEHDVEGRESRRVSVVMLHIALMSLVAWVVMVLAWHAAAMLTGRLGAASISLCVAAVWCFLARGRGPEPHGDWTEPPGDWTEPPGADTTSE